MVESEGAVRRLGPVELANVRRKQRAFRDIIDQMAAVRRSALDVQIERAEAVGDLEAAETYRVMRRTAKRMALTSAERKEAMRDLQLYHHPRTQKGRRRAARKGLTPSEAREREKQALKVLGRREGIPDYVEPGETDLWRRRRGRFSRVA
jgi:hypothetical protein